MDKKTAWMLVKNCSLFDLETLWGEPRDLLLKDGTIAAVAPRLDPPEGCGVLDAAGRMVTPGLVESHCHMGMKRMARDGSQDLNESTSPLTPALRAVDALYLPDPAFSQALSEGVTTVVTGPGSTNLIGGTFAAVKTGGGSGRARVFLPEVCMKMALGENPKDTYRAAGGPSTRMMSAAMIRENLWRAREYREAWNAYCAAGKEGLFSYDLPLHALMRVFDGLPVKFHCHQENDILTAIRISEEFGLAYTLDHCSAGAYLLEELKAHGCRCIIGPLLGGKSKLELERRTFALGGLLERSGIEFALATDFPVLSIETLRIQAALLIRHGLSWDDALRSLTRSAARLTGLDHRIGSLTVGKDADLVVWEEEPFSTRGRAAAVFVDGMLCWEKGMAACC